VEAQRQCGLPLFCVHKATAARILCKKPMRSGCHYAIILLPRGYCQAMRRLTRKWNQFTAKMLDLPQDVVQDLPRVTMIGNVQLYVENHRGVLHFSSELLRLELTKGKLEVYGNQLVIRAILSEEVFIEGIIADIKYIP
jgi:sporulation protein YqfC